MPRRTRQGARATDPPALPSRRLAEIDSAFDSAVGYSAPVAGPDDDADESNARRRRARKGKARAVVPDDEVEDEHEDEAMDMVASTSLGAGGFEQPLAGNSVGGGHTSGFSGGGGFVVEPEASTGGGFFLPETSEPSTGGGFLPDPPPPPTTTTNFGGGGFLVDDSDSTMANSDTYATFGSGGGFLQDPNANDTPFSGGGGFFPSATTYGDDPTRFALASDAVQGQGGFLPGLPPLDPAASFSLPAPPRPDRIPLSLIPTALRSLRVPRGSEKEVMEMFEEVASDDEEAEGGKSVRRERFREALEVLLGDDQDEDEDEDEESAEKEDGEENDEGEDEYREANEPRKRRIPPAMSTRTTRRSTRANPTTTEPEDGHVDSVDFAGDLPSESSDSASPSEDDDDDADDVGAPTRRGKGSKQKKPAAKGRSAKSQKTRYDPLAPVSKKELAAAADSFDLFFEDSPQLALKQDERVIGVAELERACRVLKEKLNEDDLREMLEFAGRSRGLVDIESFARILVETGL
ncbi:hypothetical protein JCM10212_005454 [Sporobolomyces blumeae]